MIYAEILSFELPLMIEHREGPGNRLRSDRLNPKLVSKALANLSQSESKVYFNWLRKSRGRVPLWVTCLLSQGIYAISINLSLRIYVCAYI
jgi:hypothetical protein